VRWDAATHHEPLRAAGEDNDYTVRFEAALTLWKLTGERKPLLRATTDAFDDRQPIANGDYNTYYRRRETLSSIAEMGKAGAFLTVPVLRALSPDHDELVIDAAEVLGGFGAAAREAIPALKKVAKNTDYPIRKAALDALQKVESLQGEKQP
jgi:HEAT repeat protein